MAEETNTPENNNATDRSFVHLQAIYLKDVSFESPSSPQIFQSENFDPVMELQYNLKTVELGKDLVEVILRVNLHAKNNDMTAYMVELQQAGIFHTGEHISDEQLTWILEVYCPNIIFPYARAELAQLITQGGFPIYHLMPVNFEALHKQKKQRQEEQSEEQPADT